MSAFVVSFFNDPVASAARFYIPASIAVSLENNRFFGRTICRRPGEFILVKYCAASAKTNEPGLCAIGRVKASQSSHLVLTRHTLLSPMGAN